MNHPHPTRPRAAFLSRRNLGRLVVALVLGVLLLARGRTVTMECVSPFAAPAAAGAAAMPPMPATDWFATHPMHGQSVNASPADSFLVEGTYFDENNDGTFTQIDTAKIVTGDVILWKWVVGSHTITSGTGSTDPNVGALFDVSSSSTATRFSYQFNSTGTYPFFCRIHESFNMKGVVVVTQNLSGVGPAPAPGGEGFVAAPWPNPTHAGATFRYALSRPGTARLTILDAQGRRIATLLDGPAGAGTFESHWSGRTSAGTAAPAGVYFARLDVPGRSQTRRIAVVP